jgi:hypothetical protein
MDTILWLAPIPGLDLFHFVAIQHITIIKG